MELRSAVTWGGTYLHAALPHEQAKGRTLCGARYTDAQPLGEREPFQVLARGGAT